MERFFYEDVLKQKVDFFNNFRLRQRRQILFWIKFSLLLFFSIVILLLCVQFVSASKYSSLQQTESDLLEKIEKLHLKTKHLFEYRKQNESLVAVNISLKESEQYKTKLINLFRVIAGLIPQNIWLEKIVVNSLSVRLEGVSSRSDELRDFYKRFSELPIVKNCCLKQFFLDGCFRFSVTCSISNTVK